MALARKHFFVFLLFCGVISVAFYYSEIKNDSDNRPSSNTFVGRNKRRANLFEEGYVNDNSTQENNQYDNTTGSCHLNFSVADTENAHSFFTRELPKHEYTNAVYIYLKKAHKTGSKDERSNKWNGLQEWIWVKRESKYHSLNLPVDLDSLTLTISKYGTHALTISWTLPINCNSLIEDDLIYNNETENIVKYMWSNVVGNITNTELCHRNFDRDKYILMVILWITTVWVGYDYDCYPINSLIEGNIENSPISKYDLSKILTLAVMIVCYMHPFLWHILESIQLNKTNELHKYYKNIANVHKPYGIIRVLQKIYFNTWHNTEKRTDFETKFTPIARYIIFLTIIVFSMNCYKLLNIKNELFEEDAYRNFPEVYRFGVPEYKCVPPMLELLFSVVIYAVSNIWIYIVYNISDDFIICIPKCLCRVKHWCIPVRNVLQIESLGGNKEDKKNNEGIQNADKQNNVGIQNADKENNDLILDTGKQLIYRFTLLFSVQFWRFIFTYSMCSRCGDNCKKSECCSKPKTTTSCCLTYIFCHIPFGIIILFFNIIFNILFCSLPALWFVIYIPITIFKNCSSCCCATSVNQESLKTLIKNICHIFLWFCYVGTLRVQVGFYIFIVRSFFFTIIIGFTGPPHIWNIYVIVVTSLTYFATYFSQFIGTYNILLKKVFEIKEKHDSNTKQTVSIEERKAKTDSNTTETEYIDERIFNYIVDNCYLAKKRFFLLILKTTLTVIFLSVSLQILQITNNIDNNKDIIDILAYIMIIISPQIISMLSNNNDEDEVSMYMSEIKRLYDSISNNNEVIKERYKGDVWYQKFISGSVTEKMCTSLSSGIRACRTCLSNCFLLEIVGLLTKALFDWSNITCDHSQLLSLADIDNENECHQPGYIQIQD